MKKKLLAVLLVLVLVLSVSVPASAATSQVKDTYNGMSLIKTANEWTLEVTTDFCGEVYYCDNETTYSITVNGANTYSLTTQTGYKGMLSFVRPAEPAVVEPYIIGTRTITVRTFEGKTDSIGFLANQKNQKGPKANYITADIEESYTITVTVYDVWSNGDETLNEEKSYTETKTNSITGKSNALPNGAETNLVPTFEGGLETYSLTVSYKGNGNKFSYTLTGEPALKCGEISDEYDYFEE